jgi:hypothetical protein
MLAKNIRFKIAMLVQKICIISILGNYWRISPSKEEKWLIAAIPSYP